MTIDELLNMYGSGYKFSKQTGISTNSFYAWKARGFIPIVSQMKIQELTEGKLRANCEDAKHAE